MRDVFSELPDMRLELIDGQFIVGANIEGTKRLLNLLLEIWGGNAALSLTTSVTPWIKALNAAYDLQLATDTAIAEEDFFPQQQVEPKTTLLPKTGNDQRALILAGELRMALFGAKAFEVLGRDFTIKLGQDALSPHGIVIKNPAARLCEYYLDGPPDIAFEFVRDETALHKHFEIYLRNGINELWVFNVTTGQVEAFSFAFVQYVQEFRGDCGVITSSAVPALQVEVKRGWQQRKWSELHDAFEVIAAPPKQQRTLKTKRDCVGWDSLLFQPILEMEPFPLTFDEFIAWTGEAKFEGYDGRITVGTPDGTRNIFGQLLLTLGLIEAVKLMPPVFWLTAINERIHQLQQQENLKEEMWQVIQQAITVLRNKFGFAKIGVAGDLVGDAPIGLWSRVALVFPEQKRPHNYFEIFEALQAEVEGRLHTYYKDDYVPLEIRKTFAQMIFV